MMDATLEKRAEDLSAETYTPQLPVVKEEPDREHGREVVPSYHNLPAVKPSHYHRKTALSFFSEAVGGGSQVIATLLSLLGGGEAKVIRAARYLALASAVTSPALLISELHMPRRWFNMLRIFRSTSAMSIGNLSLTLFGIGSALTAAGQRLGDGGHQQTAQPLTLFGYPAALAGAMICIYPGSEVEQTASPLWRKSFPLLSPLFAATGLSVGASALSIAALLLHEPPETRERLRKLSLTAQGVQLLLMLKLRNAWMKRAATAAGRSPVSRRFTFGVLGAGLLLPVTLRLLSSPDGRGQQSEWLAAGATLAGAYLLYDTVLEAGNLSAQEPKEYLEYSRQSEEPGKTARKPAVNRWKILGYSLLAVSVCAGMFWKRRSNR